MRTSRNHKSPPLRLETLERRQLLGSAADLLISGEADLVNDHTEFMGNTYNGFEINSQEATFSSLPGTITRISFLDPGGDLIFAEFGSDDPNTTLTIGLEDFVEEAPSPYTQPGTTYAQGLATFTIAGSTAGTFFSVFSLGSDPTRVDNALINDNTFTEFTDNTATIREIIVNDSATNLMGGINADNRNLYFRHRHHRHSGPKYRCSAIRFRGRYRRHRNSLSPRAVRSGLHDRLL